MTKQEIHVSDEILHACSTLQLGYVLGDVKNCEKNELLWHETEELAEELRQTVRLDQIGKIPAIFHTRTFYKALGKDPSRYRPSAEALLRRIVQGKGLYQLNCLVDLVNYLSLKSGFSIGGYDVEKIFGSLTLRKGNKKDVFQAIGRGELNIENLPVLCDDNGPIGSPTSDSIKTSISISTRTVLIVYFDFFGYDKLKEWLEITIDLLIRYAHAQHIQKDLLQFT